MIGRIKDITYTRNGEQIISITTRSTQSFEPLKDFDIDFSVQKHRKKRSKDANAYLWVLCDKIAEKLSYGGQTTTKEDVYRNAIREIGVFKDFPDLPEAEAATLRTAWGMLGTGWITEQVDYSSDGDRVTVRCYYGSSQYNTKQMSRLIDNLVQDCKALGIPTETPEEIEQIKSLWANAPKE